MHSHASFQLNSMWNRLRRTRNWPYLALLIFVVLPLLWIAYSLAVRSGMFKFSGAPSSEQVKLFLTFIGGGLATAATLFAALFTREHNIHEGQRLRLEAVLKSLDSLPAETQRPRMAGVLSTMVLLGQQRIAIRVLEPAWEGGEVDRGTATWLVVQILTGNASYGDSADNDHSDATSINEAAALLARHAYQLTDENMYYFPGHFMRHWRTEKELPTRAKYSLLLAMGRMLVSRDKKWWCPSGDPPRWPTTVLVECAEHEDDQSIRSSAAVLLAALYEHFPAQFADHLPADKLASIMKQAAEAEKATSAVREYLSLANKIRTEWETPESHGEAGDVPLRAVAADV